jgi:hypothetical protein
MMRNGVDGYLLQEQTTGTQQAITNSPCIQHAIPPADPTSFASPRPLSTRLCADCQGNNETTIQRTNEKVTEQTSAVWRLARAESLGRAFENELRRLPPFVLDASVRLMGMSVWVCVHSTKHKHTRKTKETLWMYHLTHA